MTRWAIYSSLGWLVAWLTASLMGSITVGESEGILQGSKWQTLLPAFGFVGLMIFGMNYHFVPLFSGRRLGIPLAALVQVVVANYAVLALLASSVPGLHEMEGMGYLLWFIASALFLAVLIATFRGPIKARRPRPDSRLGRMGTPMTMAASGYLLASAFLLLWGSVAASSLLPFAAGVHLYTFGFITLMVYGVGLHLFPRFQGGEPSLGPVALMVGTALSAPAGMAAFMFGHPLGFAAFASLGATSAFAFLLILVQIWARSSRPRPFYKLNLASASMLAIGVSLGVSFAVQPDLRLLAPLHAKINLLGFAGLMIFGVTHEILPPYAWRGYATSLRVGGLHLAGVLVGLALISMKYLGLLFGSPWPEAWSQLAYWLTLAGNVLLLLTGLSYVAGTVGTLHEIKAVFEQVAT